MSLLLRLRSCTGGSIPIRRSVTTTIASASRAVTGITTFDSSMLCGTSSSHYDDQKFSIRRCYLSNKATQAVNLSSFSEPDPLDLFAFDGPSTLDSVSVTKDNTVLSANIKTSDPDAQLRADIRVMGSLLGSVISQHDGPELLEKVETMRLLAKKWRNTDETHDTREALFLSLASFASQMDNEQLFLVSRAFTHFLALVSTAEYHHRSRRTKETTLESSVNAGALYPKRDSCGGVIPKLLEIGIPTDDIFDAISSQTTELVLTAHPTEVNRRTILDKKRRIHEILNAADNYRVINSSKKNNYEMEQMHRALAREIASIWLSDEVSRVKPTPEQEAEKGTLILETVLWKTVPQYLRKLDATCVEFLNGRRLPLEAEPIRFASWMGGDRDGNPNVLPDTTRRVCLRNRIKAAELFYNDIRTLRNELSITKCSPEVIAIVGDDDHEPIRTILDMVLTKLDNTREWAKQELDNLQQNNVKESTATVRASALAKRMKRDDIYLDQNKFRNDLMLVYNSLCTTGNELIADGLLTDVLRNISAFGLTLIPLDIRQESGRHEEAVDAITRFLGLGSYSQWDEQTKINWLSAQISFKRPLLRQGVWHDHPEIFTPTIVDTLEIFSMIAEQHQGSLGAYVISQAKSASDVLEVLLLQIDAGVKKPLRVAPLFETLDDLNNAVGTMKSLFTLPAYMGIINGKQEVMIGYSDSAKDAGRLSAVWAQYNTQEELAEVARKYNVDMTFFHGKGGTVGRGGNPQTFLAIMAHAPRTINGYFRVTEQGEMISQNFGFGEVAERTLDIYTSAILAEKLTPRPKVKESWKDKMDELSTISCNAYRKIVREDSRFIPYFRQATPDLTGLNIGSRPTKRSATGGIESLRAIPWNFAWTQTRLNLPTWLGVGEALGTALNSPQADLVHEMYSDWDTFRTMVDLVEMVLAKSDPAIAKHYEDILVNNESAKELGAEVRATHLATEQVILELTGHTKLAEHNRMLTRALQVKKPYIDCLNVLQAETLKRIRKQQSLSADGDVDQLLKDALATTITGIANGMGNTG